MVEMVTSRNQAKEKVRYTIVFISDHNYMHLFRLYGWQTKCLWLPRSVCSHVYKQHLGYLLIYKNVLYLNIFTKRRGI